MRHRQASGSSVGSGSSADNERVQIYVVDAKFEPDAIQTIYQLIESHALHGSLQLGLCSNAAEANVIITKIRMRKRLERHLKWDIARQKAIVTPDWLFDSIAQNTIVPCGKYAAIDELLESTARNCPDCHMAVCTCVRADSFRVKSQDDIPPTAEKIFKNYGARLACQRASPLVCPNQPLAEELDVLRLHRHLEGKGINALAYDHAIATIKAYPTKITPESFEKEVVHLPYIGDKIQSKIREYLKLGIIPEACDIRTDQRFQSLREFTKVYGVGATTARELYSRGLRTIQDMKNYYEVYDVDGDAEEEEPIYTPNGKLVPKQTTKEGIPALTIPAALTLVDDLEQKITREEVEEIRDVVMNELKVIQPGCISTIVGGYRRGKKICNDVDLIISHPSQEVGADTTKGLCKKLVQRLHERGLVTHMMREDNFTPPKGLQSVTLSILDLSGFHAHNPLRNTHWDSLEKALTIIRLPPDGNKKRYHRQMDLIFAAPEAYWTAILGWTGSKTFERDLRTWAKEQKGMKFDSSGLTRRHDSMLLFPKSEQDIFDILGLEWIHPTMRNANV